jgi:uncharacterized protein YbaP (TraB family)
MRLDRRGFIVSVAVAGLSAPTLAHAATSAAGPILHRVRHGSGTIFMVGYSDATDNGWFVPKIASALDTATVLWLETPPGSQAAATEGQATAAPPPDPELTRIFTERAFDRSRDLFAVLPVETSRRTREWAARVGVARDTLAPMRPWFARITIQQAYAAQKQAAAAEGAKLVSPERIVVDRARQRGIPVESEYPTIAHLFRFFAELPDPAQAQYLDELFDYFDRDAAGRNDEGKYGWITGHPSSVSLDEQRERTPDLYRAMHIERNAWWCGRIEGMLAAGQTAFLMLGQNHTLGPDSVQANLARRGFSVERL